MNWLDGLLQQLLYFPIYLNTFSTNTTMITTSSIIDLIKAMPMNDKIQVINAIQKDIDSERRKSLSQNFILVTAPIDEFEECPNIK